MPTPSQPPLDPTSPPPYVFPTCPDDQPHADEQADELSQPESDEMEVRPGSSTVVASPSPYTSHPTHDAQDGLSTDDVMRFDGHDHIETTAFRTSSPTPSSDKTAPAGEQEGDECLTHDADDRGLLTSQRPSTVTNSASLSTPDTTSAVCSSGVDGMEVDEYDFSSIGNDCSRLRTIPISPSSYLRPGSKFRGTQRSERQRYEVQVEIKHVDMRESFLCGYLRIQGLTEDHPTLTTYFEGEIIGTKYNFYTQHEDWGANVKVDLNHWSKFRAFKPFIKMARKGPVSIPDNAQKEYIFMRWKEHFLVPDHRVRTITGASFEGFYYICFNQLKGEVNGIYFHSKSEKFQQLELMHVPDRGCFSALEFR